MKTLSYLKKISLIALATFVISSCEEDGITQIKNDDGNAINTEELNIIEILSADPNFSSFVAFLEEANLTSVLAADGKKTILAPTNDAFENYIDDNDFLSFEDIPDTVLTELLLNHVIPDSSYTTTSLKALRTGYDKTLATGPNNTNVNIYFNGISGLAFNSVPVTGNQINAKNGTIHVVNGVVPPATLAILIGSNPSFSGLVDAIIHVEDLGSPTLQPSYSEVLNNQTELGPFTVFAPLGSAFNTLKTSLGVQNIEDIPTETVDAVLLRHIVNGITPIDGFVDGEITTLDGGTITVNMAGSTLTDKDGTGRILPAISDLQATNGILHVVNRVIGETTKE
ncbi:fasciclin domain-containing protein [Algibacter miyuki]|uniref:Fasciclin domain-containing protein n=1 Tax=Algibacter miyuki TaxID=1306933 RepID=A0ABV5H4N2_9FLAO|nr:fasciclin domain-containing protein [Algibacter miyuki]MDN3663995.1 fasciclin domain-containing protein [Algibacter miyuki]